MNSLRWSLVVVVLVLSLNSTAQDKAALIDKMMQYASENGLYSGVLMVVESGHVIYNKGFGYADIETGKMNDRFTLFNLCSITKQFTAMCIMMLKEEGRISYDDKLIKYFPRLPYPEVTLRQLLNHTSGLPDYFRTVIRDWHSERIPRNDDIIFLMEENHYPLNFPSGQRYEYCNTGYMLLASIIEKVAGISYAEFLHEHIFRKLAMMRTEVYMPNVSKEPPDNLASPYVYDYLQCRQVPTRDYPLYTAQVTGLGGTVGDGGIYSCGDDMEKWDAALKTEGLVKKTTMEEAFTNGILNDGKPIAAPIGYGFGWFIVTDPVNGRIVQHTGGWPGFRQAFIRYLDKDWTILVLRNNEVVFSSMQQAIENILQGRPFNMPETSVAYALGQAALTGTAANVRQTFATMKTVGTANEVDINQAGYGALAKGRLTQALEIMRINAELHPQSWNAFDSLGELFLKNGDKENARSSYKRSLELNPLNQQAKAVLKNLE